MKKLATLILFFFILLSTAQNSSAQCAMCSINAEQGVKNGNTLTKGINNGVLYLLAIPYLLVGGIGGLWYMNYRKKNNQHDIEP